MVYNSKQWKRTREAYTLSKFGICERCGTPNAKQVHHKKYLTPENINNPDITLSFDNLELLCDVCHQKEHFAEKQEYSFDENGDLIKNG